MKNPRDPYIESINGDRYRVKGDYVVDFDEFASVTIVIPDGFITDLASIPWWFRWLWDRASLGSFAPVLHDYLCSVRGQVRGKNGVEFKIDWFDVHLIFLIAMRLDGIGYFRALIAFLAVLIGVKKWS
jgi:hypothetical protein